MKIRFKRILALISILLLSACATYKPQYNTEVISGNFDEDNIVHSIYLIGDAGNSPLGTKSAALAAFEKSLKQAKKNSTALFLGDNIYPKGMPSKNEEGRTYAEHQLNVQTDVVKEFKGDAIFIPGNHDWYSNGLKGLKRQENYIEDRLGKNTFLPENGCPIEKVEISDDIELIIIDSEWFVTDWDKHPTINDDCEIKTRFKFFEELEGLIKKARGKTTVIAIHHPMYSNGPHGGEYSFGAHMKPLPILGTLKNVLRETSGVSPADLQHKRYHTLKKRLVTLAQENDKVVFVSGHDHNLQYIEQDNLVQIISGAGAKSTATRNVKDAFSSSEGGFARLDVLNDGSSYVRFFSAKNDNVIFQTQVFAEDKKEHVSSYPKDFPETVNASVYSEDEVSKSRFYKTIWGERYRKYYGVKVNAPTVNLDTLFGGLKPFRKGGGHQSKSLHLINDEGKRYVMRAIRKSAVVYLQAMAFKDQYIEGQFDDTKTEELLSDFYTGSHPYAPFVTGKLSDAVNLFHTNPVLYYVPKQNALGQYNVNFGDELYMIEEHVSDSHKNLKSFGYTKSIESTDDLMKKLRKDEKYSVDETTFLRARLFDMAIGDWDRHTDQWRWAAFKENGKVIYKPIPRDRDQAFSIMGDGALMQFATRVIPPLKLMEGFDEGVRNVKGFNFSPFSLDMMLLNQTSKKQWEEQVAFIQENLTGHVIDEALQDFPKEVQTETVAEIKSILKARLKNLPKIANDYFKVLNKNVLIKGTDKDDLFEIERMPNGNTKVSGYRIKKGEKGMRFFEKTFNKDITKEVWIYGLDDEDVFKVFGEGNDLIKVRLVGGQNKDVYTIQNGKKVKFYDYKSKKSEITTNKGSKKLTDDYETNIYDYSKPKNNTNLFVPTIGANPDDGFKIGFVNTFTGYGFERNPFTSQHIVSSAYYFATNGFELGYNGEFANVVGNWNLALDANFTSPNYAINFFGFGNSTPNPEANENDGLDVDLDYNRVKLQTLRFAPALIWRGDLGASFKVGLKYESVEIEETEGRFINQFANNNIEDVENHFVGAEVAYAYQNHDNEAFPTMGMNFSLSAGYVSKLKTSEGFAYLIPELSFDYKLIHSGQLVLATKSRGHFNLGDDFEFYQAANIGANSGLRGYRNERFTGKSAFVQTSDLRLNLRKFKTGLLPLNIGIYGGFDIGKVWVDDDMVLNVAHNSNVWNTSIGGGVFANLANLATLNVSAFNSDDGLRFAFKVGFGF